MTMAVALPRPNHRMNTGTQASDGIGISALASGRKKPSTAAEAAHQDAERQADGDRQPHAEQHAVQSVLAAWPGRLPSSTPSTRARPTAGSVGSSAAGKMPLRARAS